VPSETSKGGGIKTYRPLPFDVSEMRKTYALDRELTTNQRIIKNVSNSQLFRHLS
jgi:hypothetical protein